MQAKGVEIVLPTDVIVADKFAPDANTQVVDVNAIPDGWMVSSPACLAAAKWLRRPRPAAGAAADAIAAGSLRPPCEHAFVRKPALMHARAHASPPLPRATGSGHRPQVDRPAEGHPEGRQDRDLERPHGRCVPAQIMHSVVC